jgi:hypothetical protein
MSLQLKKIWMVLLPVLLIAQAVAAQYVNKLYDYDSSYDWGTNVFVKSNGNYFIEGQSMNVHTGRWALYTMEIVKDGDTVRNKKYIVFDSVASCGDGNTGTIRRTPDGGYIIPFTIEPQTASFAASLSGIIKLDSEGNTVFIKTYTDTSVYDYMSDCAIAKDGSIYLSGERSDTAAGSPNVVLITKTDSSGNLRWQKTYRKHPGDNARGNSIDLLPDGRILVGAYIKSLIWVGSYYYYKQAPWYILLDSNGNIEKDSFWSNGYMAYTSSGCSIYKDMNGGFYTWAAYDSVYTDTSVKDPNNPDSFPNFIAHLDTNFTITWAIDFPSRLSGKRRAIWKVIQLYDSSYLAIGDQLDTVGYYKILNFFQKGWCAKIDKHGKRLWEREYICDIKHDAYLTDAREKSDESIILVGQTMNDSLPYWHTTEDIWLLGIDSNGWTPGCDTTHDTTTIVSIQGHFNNDVKVWPNPTSGSVQLAVNSEQIGGVYQIADISGRILLQGQLITQQQTIDISDLNAGMYFLQVRSKDGFLQTVKVVKE